jgi:hypothetical protein
MLQLKVGGRREISSIELSRLQARQGRDAKEKVAERAQTPHHPRAVLRGGVTQQHTATAAASATLSCTALPPLLSHNQQAPIQSVQAPNANSSSLYHMFRVEVMIF